MRFILSLVFLVTVLVHPAAAVERRCAATNATVNADSAYDAELACAGAADAVAFLARQGFTVDTVMRIDVLDSVFLHTSDSPSFRILGQFDAKQNRIKVTSIAGQREMAKEKPIFGVPYDVASFRSVVAHEVAHAIAEDNFRVEEPTRMAHEYIACIVQMAIMPPRLSQQIFESTPGEAFESELEINPLIYGLNPNLFAVKAYRHYLSPGVGMTFLQTLLRRDLMSIFPRWEDSVSRDPLADVQLANRSSDRR